jgi:hypothetical protein
MHYNLTHKEHSTFLLTKDGEEIANFKYNRNSSSIRLHYSQKRLFFLSQEGLLQNKILLKTEYGVAIGENYYIKNHRKGILHLSDKKFHYTVEQNGVQLCDKKKQPLAGIAFEGAGTIDSHEMSAVVFSMAWLLLSETTAHKALSPYAS